MSTWVKLHRQLWDNPRTSDPEWVSVWLYLLCHAAHKPVNVVFKGVRTSLKPGQLCTSIRIISKHTGVPRSKVHRVLETLKSETQIKTEISNLNTLISILNWTKYQTRETDSETRMRHERDTDETQNKNDKKLKEDLLAEKIPPSPKSQNLKKVNEGGEQITQALALRTDLKLAYLKKYPEHYWTAKDATNLVQLSNKLIHRLKLKHGTEPTHEKTLEAFEFLLDHPLDWMTNQGSVTIPDFNSQFDKIVNKIKAEA